MTIYAYRCEQCSEQIDQDFPMGEQPETVKCPACGETARRVFEPLPIHYKGFGWSWSMRGVQHGDPDMDDREREKVPKPWEFDDLTEE